MTLKELDEFLLYANEQDDETRTAHMGIFGDCRGEISVNYLGDDIATIDVENSVMETYAFRDIGYLTWQEFMANFSRVWNKYFGILRENLENSEAFTVVDAKETVKETIDTIADTKTTGQGSVRYSDTPNQYLNGGQNPQQYLTTFTGNQTAGTGESTGNTKRTLETDKGGNAFERWLSLSAENRNILYDFVHKFAILFKNTYIVR